MNTLRGEGNSIATNARTYRISEEFGRGIPIGPRESRFGPQSGGIKEEEGKEKGGRKENGARAGQTMGTPGGKGGPAGTANPKGPIQGRRPGWLSRSRRSSQASTSKMHVITRRNSIMTLPTWTQRLRLPAHPRRESGDFREGNSRAFSRSRSLDPPPESCPRI